MEIMGLEKRNNNNFLPDLAFLLRFINKSRNETFILKLLFVFFNYKHIIPLVLISFVTKSKNIKDYIRILH